MKIVNKFKSIISILLVCYCSASAGADYRLGAGDTIQVDVYNEADLSMQHLISTSGQIEYPYLGKINVLGKTTGQLQQEITEGLSGDYLIEPKVSINVTKYRMIYVNGEVTKPGGYSFQPGLTVEKAIALAGGFTERAAKNKIMVRAGEANGKSQGKELKAKIAPGDIIIVKASFF